MANFNPPTNGFKKGKASPNPSGRPKGLINAVILRNSITEDMPAIIAKMTELAIAGDVVAAKLLMDRSCAPLKPQNDTIVIPDEGLTLSEKGNVIIAAMFEGKLSSTIGAAMVSALASQARIVEIDDLTARLNALEAAANGV